MKPSDIPVSASVVRLAPSMKMIGQKVAARRKKLMITQKDLAEMAGVSSRMVSMVERGLANPTVAELSDMIKPLGFVITLQERVINP
jgi:predicted transcriptional regulator